MSYKLPKFYVDYTLYIGAILVFLPGYDEIMMLRERILEQKNFSENSRLKIYDVNCFNNLLAQCLWLNKAISKYHLSECLKT